MTGTEALSTTTDRPEGGSSLPIKSRTGWTVRTLPCTHFVQIDMPDELTALLQTAA